MSHAVIGDAGPLIALARISQLSLLKTLYHEILIPPTVRSELEIGSNRPGAIQLGSAEKDGWLRTVAPEPYTLLLNLDQGELEAIALGLQINCRFLLIDEAKGRKAARRQGIHVVGITGVLLAAKERSLIPEVMAELERLHPFYRFSEPLIERIKSLAGE